MICGLGFGLFHGVQKFIILHPSLQVSNLAYDAIYHKDNEFGDRISRNQLLVLKHESYFNQVHNPADGAYYIESLTEQLANYIKSPIVNIRITNFKITVLGEVLRPGSYSVPNERISIIEALGLAGDLTIQGKRNTVSLIREVQGERKFVTIDLTNKKLFDSPYYYLAQNDVIYVEPNKTKVNSSAVGSNAGLILSSISTLISLVAILTR